MIAAIEHDLVWAAAITGSLTFVGMVITAVIAWLNHRAIRIVGATTTSTDAQVTPENGAKLGPLVEQISRTADAIDGRLHESSKRTDGVERTVDRIEAKLDQHLAETASLIVRARKEWGPTAND